MSFKAGDKVTHAWTGELVLTVRWAGDEFMRANNDTNDVHGYEGLTRPVREFTPYTPPRPSTQELANRVYRAYGDLVDPVFGDQTTVLARVQALAEAATAYAERLEEETK